MEKYKQYQNSPEYEFVPYSNKYGNGGMAKITPNTFSGNKVQEEIEGGETVQTPDGTNYQAIGPKHENGGIKTNLEPNTRIFSDRLKFNGKTFAQIAKPIQSKISKLDNKPTSKALENTKMLFNKQLDNVFNEQETLKQEQNMKKNIFAKGGIKFTPQESLDNRLPIENPQYVPSNNNQAIYQALTKTPQGKFYMNNNVPNGNGTGYGDEYEKQRSLDAESAINPKSTSFNNYSEIGAGLTGLAGMYGQIRNNNNIKAPNAFNNVYLGNGPRPDMVDYSAELNGINNEFNSAKQGLRLGSGSYSTQVGNLGKMRADQLNARGKVMQGQENANTQLMNEYKNRVAENANKSQLMNFEIGKENEYNRLGYDQWRAKNNNEAIANATQIGTNIFNNRTGYNNQMEQAKIMANSKDGTVFNDASFNTNFEKQYYNQLNPTQKAQHNARRQQKGLQPLEFRNGGMIKTKIKR
jgi:hypothetical protein